MPPCSYTPYICMPLYIHTPAGVYTCHMPQTLLCHCVFLEALHVVGGCNGLPFVLGDPPYITPVWGYLPLIHPHTQSLVPCALVCFRDISMLHGHFPSVEGFGGVSPIS